MKRYSLFTIAGLLVLALAIGIGTVLASPESAPTPKASPLHPNFALLDADGTNVLESGGAVSTIKPADNATTQISSKAVPFTPTSA